MKKQASLKQLNERILDLQALNTTMGFALQAQAEVILVVCKKCACTIGGKTPDLYLTERTKELTNDFLREFADEEMNEASRIAKRIAEMEEGGADGKV